jgi:uncharacterized NAD-dependent epimerase/dehydratase family protein
MAGTSIAMAPALVLGQLCSNVDLGGRENSRVNLETTMNDQQLAEKVPQPYLLFLGDVQEKAYAKTALGIRDWVPEQCVGELALAACSVSTGLPNLTPSEAYAAGARSLVIGVAPSGGKIEERWIPTLCAALDAGLDLVSGMHISLATVPVLRSAADRLGRRLIDIRCPPANLAIATGRRRTGYRLLTVGTDCALGKKYTALALTRNFRARGVVADFRATGQTGILIAGGGIPIDAVVADFVAGAAEALSPAAAPDHWDVIEGQGSLFHPAYAGVSLGLLHGSQPDVLVVCHDPQRTKMLGFPSYSVPSIEETIELNLLHARRVNPEARCAGVSLNTASLSECEARSIMAETAARCGLPTGDPIRGAAEFDTVTSSCLGD